MSSSKAKQASEPASKTTSKPANKAANKPAKSASNAAPKPAAVMKDVVSRTELTHAVATASEVYRSNAMGVGVEAHMAMTFDGDFIRASTFAAAIKFPLKTKFKANVNGQTLAKIVGAFENHGADDVKVSIKDSKMAISSGRSNVETVTLQTDAGDIVSLKGAAELKVDAKTRDAILLAMSQALRCAATNDVRYYLNGIHFTVENGDLIVLGVDGLSICRVNTGIKGADKFNGMSLTRDAAESLIAIASRIECTEDVMFYKKDTFGWRFSNGAEMRATVLETPQDSNGDFADALNKLVDMNTDKLSVVDTPDGLVDALSAGKIAATNGSPVYFNVENGVMSVKTGDINTGMVYRTTDIATKVRDTEAAYDVSLLTKIVKNPADKILFYKDGPLYIGNVDMNDSGEGVRTFLMPMRV